MQSNILWYIAWDNHHNKWVIRVDYSDNAKNELLRIVKNWIDDQAVIRKNEEWISIDWVDSLDLDDAIWVEKTSNWYSLFVHISDVTEAIKIYSQLDIEAMKRTTSIYRREWVINMLPPSLSQDMLSLNENWLKSTLTMRIDLDNYTYICWFEVYESMFKNRRRYNYTDFMDDFENPDCDNHSLLHLMYEIALKRRTLRKIDWVNMEFDESDRRLYIWTKDEKTSYINKQIASVIIEEFMILANISSAIICVNSKYNSIFRLHDSCTENAYYSNAPGLHTWLALQYYSHFTSPIRRYADIVIHRVLKSIIRWEPGPYTELEIADIAKYINFSREVIDRSWRIADRELKWYNLVSKIKNRIWKDLNTSHLTTTIRQSIWNWRKIPKVITGEIINDLENWDKSNWAWAIWVFLVSWDNDIKKYLKKALLDDKKFQPKAVIWLLNVTKVLTSDTWYLFEIIETEDWEKFSIDVNFKWEKLLRRKSINYWKYSREDAIWILRKKTIEWILTHFCWK